MSYKHRQKNVCFRALKAKNRKRTSYYSNTAYTFVEYLSELRSRYYCAYIQIMPVNTQSQEYLSKLKQWSTVRDCVEGQLAIQEGGVKYLPRLSGQTQAEYVAYQNRAVFFDGTSRTAEGLHGHIFAKDPVQAGKITNAIRKHLDNVDNAGTNIDEFASNITWDAIQTGFGGILVDHANVPEGLSKAEAEKYGGAFLIWYAAESIIKYRHSFLDGAKKLKLVILREDIEEENPEDEFETIVTEAYRVLAFDNNNRYYQRVFKKNKNKVNSTNEKFIPDEPVYPKMKDGKYFNFIPFYTCPGELPEKSMLLGLAFENIGHYQKTAEYENGLFLTSFATPIAVNMDAPTKKVKKTIKDKDGNEIIKEAIEPITQTMGGGVFKFFCQRNPDGTIAPDVDVKFLEFTGAGIGEILKALNGCLDRMAKLGIQAIGAEKKGVETAEVAKIHRASESGVLGAFARSMSSKITDAGRLMLKWNQIPDELAEAWSYQLNTDYNYSVLATQILAIMHTARQTDEIPRSVWFTALKKHGMVPESMTYDEFIKEIMTDNTRGHGTHGDTDDLDDDNSDTNNNRIGNRA